MKAINGIITILFYIVLSSVQAQVELSKKELEPILSLADKSQIRERIQYLADDRLRGRLPGTLGYQMAVDYVIEKLKALDVKPKGDEGYIQRTLFRSGRVDTARSSMVVKTAQSEITLRQGRDFTFVPDLNKPNTSITADVVFAGYGITASHLKHDDYAGINAQGKIVMVLEGTPPDFPAGEKAHFNLLLSKCEVAAKHGAVGVMVLMSGNEALKISAATRANTGGIVGYVKPDGEGFSTRTNFYDQIQFAAYIRTSLVDEWVKEKKRGDLGLLVKANVTVNTSESKSENVIGIIEGTDKNLKEEYVVHTAHLDHVGVGAPVKGDSIYNGAHDNASGVSCLLEIAKLYKKAKLKRSVLIVFVTSEEKGLLGSGYFASQPTVPLKNIVADVNTDMPTLIAPLLSIEPLGAQHSSLMNPVKEAAKYLALDVMDDHMPDQVRFTRSDQYSFIRQGIPALHVKYGLKTADPSFDLRKHIDDWTEAHYHKPSDEFRDEAFNFDAAVTYVKLNFLIGWQVANTKTRPTWNKGDFFGETFGQ